MNAPDENSNDVKTEETTSEAKSTEEVNQIIETPAELQKRCTFQFLEALIKLFTPILVIGLEMRHFQQKSINKQLFTIPQQ